VANQATAAARAATAPPAFSPLADLFKNYTAQAAGANSQIGNPAYPNAQRYRNQLLFIPSAGGGGSGSISNQ
jgi:hypothetical protein